MSRKFTPDETLIDQLILDDTEAFEELHHRYCYPLYSYCISKLKSPVDARQIVRDIFISLWEKRHALPVGFSVSIHLYTSVRRAVLNCLNEKLNTKTDLPMIEEQIIPGFAVPRLMEARRPVKPSSRQEYYFPSTNQKEKRTIQPWWNQYPESSVKGMKLALQKVFHLF